MDLFFLPHISFVPFLGWKGYHIYHLLAYDLKIGENFRNLHFGCHGNIFLELKVVFSKNPEISKEFLAFFIDI